MFFRIYNSSCPFINKGKPSSISHIRIYPSATHLAPTGGMAFEGYADLLPNKHGYKMWRKFRKYKAAGDQDAQAGALFPAVVDSLLDDYYGFVMQSVANMHKAARNQKFYPSLVASYHGLSLMGMDMLSFYGYTMPSTSFLRQRKVALDNHDTTIRYTHEITHSFTTHLHCIL